MAVFSIIIPIFNIEQYLQHCIESTIHQTFDGEYEVILVDDGSTDSCPNICDSYAEKYSNIRVLHKENRGLVSARQAGTELATGEYIIPVDGDDWVDKRLLEVVYNCIEKSHADIICYNYYNCINKNNIKNNCVYDTGLYLKKDIEEKIFPNLIYSQTSKTFPAAIWAKAFKKELYTSEQMSLDAKIKIGEDAACVIPCVYKANSIYITDECLYYYRYNTNSMTKNKKAFKWNGPALIAEHLEKRMNLTEMDFQNQLYIRTIHSLFNVVKSQFYREDSYFTIIKDIKSNIANTKIYSESIREGKYNTISFGNIMKFALKWHFYAMIYIFSKIH